jgi:dipeptidyl aminopeptidase/acylaminoacyl peptidase
VFAAAVAGALVLTASLPARAAGPDLALDEVVSTKDSHAQPVRYYVPPEVKSPVPLVVLLHTWSGDYTQNTYLSKIMPEIERRRWAIIHPNFRGPNKHADACASDLAIQDVLDAVAFMKHKTSIDPHRIYLIGVGGGGHMALMVAAKSPTQWAGVSVWGPTVDLASWYKVVAAEKKPYARDLVEICGGEPGSSAAVDDEYHKRSPIHYLLRLRGMPVDINAGIHDGHTGPVPVSQSLRAFNGLCEANMHPDQKFNDEQIAYMSDRRMIPTDLEGRAADDPMREHPVLIRRSAGPARLTIFSGGADTDLPAAVDWLAQQSR